MKTLNLLPSTPLIICQGCGGVVPFIRQLIDVHSRVCPGATVGTAQQGDDREPART